MQIIKGGVKDREEMIESATEEAANFLSEILISLDQLKYWLAGGQLTKEQYNTLKEEVYHSDNGYGCNQTFVRCR